MQVSIVWTHPGMTTYYRNARGRVYFVMPFRNVDYYMMTKNFNLDDYHAESGARKAGRGKHKPR